MMSKRRCQDLATWAEEIAASLPPLTASEAAAVGRLAAALDSRQRNVDAPRALDDPVALAKAARIFRMALDRKGSRDE